MRLPTSCAWSMRLPTMLTWDTLCTDMKAHLAATVVNIVLLLGLFAALLQGCTGTLVNEYYLVGDSDVQRESRRLLSLLDEAENPDRAVIMRRLAGNLRDGGYPGRMTHLLSTHISANPDDPYNGYYLFLIGRHHQRTGDNAFAKRYFRRALYDYSDVDINGESVHFATLEALADISSDPRERIAYYEDLLERFPEEVDQGRLYYYKGRAHERLGDWDSSREAYQRFLGLGSDIPGESDAEFEVRRKLEFADSSRSWTFENLDDLKEIIQSALQRRDSRTLEQHQSDVQFFAASPGQDPTDANSTFGFNIEVFLSRSNVQVADEFTVNSNNREAYLRTSGWAERFSTWYLYFRRIDFPADPDVHGEWEWAGIRFGEIN